MNTKGYYTTKSGKLNDLIVYALTLGLIVEVDNNSPYQTIESISIKIRRNFTGEANALEAMLTSEFISIHAIRSTLDGKPRAFKLNVTKYNYLVASTSIKPTSAKYWLQMMAEDLTRYQTKTAA